MPLAEHREDTFIRKTGRSLDRGHANLPPTRCRLEKAGSGLG